MRAAQKMNKKTTLGTETQDNTQKLPQSQHFWEIKATQKRKWCRPNENTTLPKQSNLAVDSVETEGILLPKNTDSSTKQGAVDCYLVNRTQGTP